MKKGAILVGNIIFLILNVIFLVILTVFLLRYSSGVTLLEESYAKQIALMIDSSKPGMEIFVSMEEAFEIVEEKWGKEHLKDMIRIKNNVVRVQFSEDSGYSYSFFNNIDVGTYKNGYYEIDTSTQKGYIFNIGGYK